MINKTFKFFVRGLKASEVRGRIHRILSIASLLIAIGVCVVLTFAFMFRLQVVVVAFSGVLSMALAFYLFVRLCPRETGEEESVRRVDKVRTAIQQKRPQKTMTATRDPPPTRTCPEDDQRKGRPCPGEGDSRDPGAGSDGTEKGWWAVGGRRWQ